MVRVLQLIPRRPDFDSAHQIDVLNSGLSPDIQLCHWPLDCAATRYQLLVNRIRSRLATPNVVHVWDWSGLRLALAGTYCPILYSIRALESRGQVCALRRLARLARRVAFVCSTPFQKQLLEHGGVPPRRYHVIEPGIATSSVPNDQRIRLRQSLGLGEQDVIAFAPGDSNRTAQHRLSLWAISILHVYDRRYRLLISGTGSQASSLHRLAYKLKQPAVLVSASERIGRAVDQRELLSAADVAIANDSLPGSPLPTALCMTAGAPMIGDASGIAGQYASDNPSTLLLRSLRPKLLARQILESFPIGAQRSDWCSSKREDAVNRFSPVHFRRQMCDLYRSVCNGSDR